MTQSSEPPILCVRGLNVAYNDAMRFSYPDIIIRAGECVAVTGQIGCGKTTLLNALFDPAFPARVSYTEALLLGRDLRSYGNSLFREISYMPQYAQDGLNPLLTAGEQVEAVARDNGLELSRAELGMRLACLKLERAVMTRFPYQLSAGIKQRLVLLMSVIKRPRLLALDEPSSAIDALTLGAMLEFLKEVKAGGVGLLMVSHDAGFIRHIADREHRLKERAQ